MRSKARDQSKRRKWSRTTPDTYMLSARIPLDLTNKLRQYVEYTGDSITDVVVVALYQYLKEHSPMERGQEGGTGD